MDVLTSLRSVSLPSKDVFSISGSVAASNSLIFNNCFLSENIQFGFNMNPCGTKESEVTQNEFEILIPLLLVFHFLAVLRC